MKIVRRSEYQETASDHTYKELMLAKSRTLEKLSRDMAAAIKTDDRRQITDDR